MAAKVLIIGVTVACAAVEAVADQTPRAYAAAAPPTDGKRTKSEATETPRPSDKASRLSHGAPHCVQNGAFVDDACDLCYGGCHACWVYLSDTNQVACVDETTHSSWDGMETCLNEDSVPNRATTWCGATPAPTYLYCEDGYVDDCEGGSHCCPESPGSATATATTTTSFCSIVIYRAMRRTGAIASRLRNRRRSRFAGTYFPTLRGLLFLELVRRFLDDCDQPAATVDWCSFSRSNCESCSNAEWCGESDLAPHAPAPSVQAVAAALSTTTDGRPDRRRENYIARRVSCGGGTWHLPERETCAAYIDGRSPLAELRLWRRDERPLEMQKRRVGRHPGAGQFLF